MVSDKAYDIQRPGYDSGLYCKWYIEGDGDLSVRFIDMNIYPMTENCDYDGLVIIWNDTQSEERMIGMEDFKPFIGNFFPMYYKSILCHCFWYEERML